MSAIAASPPQKRIDALDVVRGVAILGILMANIAAFSEPVFARELGPQIGMDYPASRSMSDALLTALVAGKFRGMLAILFGIGLMMQFQRREAAGEKWPGSYLRRSLFLVLLGFVHALFIWYGDILLAYGITALCMMLFARANDLTLRWIIGAGLLYGLAMGAVSLMMDLAPSPAASVSGQWERILKEAPILKIWVTPAGELQTFQAGSYGMQLLHRLGTGLVGVASHLTLLPYYGALFGIGMLIARNRVWEDKEKLNGALRWGMLVGLGAGLPLNLATVPLTRAGYGDGASIMVEVCLSAVLCVGYLSLLTWLAIRVPVLMRPFANVGKVALTCYLLTSVIATTIYYSWGFARFGRSSDREDWIVIFGIWAFLLVFAAVWTRVFEYGPVEWAWRSAALGRKLGFRKADGPSSESAP